MISHHPSYDNIIIIVLIILNKKLFPVEIP